MSRIARDLQLTLHAAFREATERRHAYLTVEHLLQAIAHEARGVDILEHCGVNVSLLRSELERFFAEELERLPDDQHEIQQTIAFHRVFQRALRHVEAAEKEEVDAGDLLVAIFDESDSHAVALLRAQGVTRLDVVRYISHGIPKPDVPRRKGSAPRPQAPGRPGRGAEELPDDPLEAYAWNLSERAARGELDPVIGREAELERAIHVLERRRKNNPVFVGESGVGKTALAEGLAQRIHEGRVPPSLQGAEIYALDLGSLLAGTRYRGDFEERFKALVGALRERPRAILFVDEIHTLLGAGAASGGVVDASNLLKPLLQDGSVRCIGSTTYTEYRHFERDRALARRFQKIDVREPSVEETVRILRGLAPRYEAHHGVRYTDGALRAAAELASRYLAERFLPDKAIDVIDEAAVAVRLRTPPRSRVRVQDVEAIVARMAQRPLPRARRSERERLERLEEDLRAVVFGQDAAIRSVVRAVRRARAGLTRPERPIGSFLFTGPTGVGKTELARQLAACLGVPFLRYDMSEYMEKHAVARLIGAPPGYVGYEEGGLLIEQVRKNPYAVLLLDEIEKAHPDFFSILLQVMDRAALTDSHGREADFRHITLILTSNAGSREASARAIGFGEDRRGDGHREIERLFSPEFRNRLDEIVEFRPLSPEVMERVVEKFVSQLAARLRERGVELELAPEARARLAELGYDPVFGARPLARVIESELEDPLAERMLFGDLARGGKVRIGLEGDRFYFQVVPRVRERVPARVH